MNKLKLIIRVASLAMLVAFIFGIIAFVKADKNGELKTLYQAETSVAKESISKIDVEDFSRAEINPVTPMSDSITNTKMKTEKINANKPPVQKIANKKKTFIPKRKYAKKNISFKSFSRGSLEIAPIRKVEKPSE